MFKQDRETSESRRTFLRASLVNSVGIAAAVVAAGAAASAPAEAEPSAPENAGKGYRVTQHVADYYRTAAL
ncbi:MAG: formate dehydrogenase [Gammaproteobacteria bacterium]|nr:formate dehydrogenase [Gammaproteobacteria bacterium]MCP5458605.1 formate dehydrogenase [Gammaproteobacteria bacterium]